MRSKILVIVYNIERAREHEWLIRFMDPSRYEFEFVLINKPGSFLQKFLTENRIRTHNINYSGKVAMPLLVWKLFKLIRQGKFHLVHAHLFEATLGGMIAARLAGVKARLITRHNSDFHHRYFPSAVKYDRLAARLATHIVAVSDTVKHVLTNMEQVNESKISVIHHGIDFSEFELTPERSRKVEQLRIKYNIPANKKVVGVVSRFIHWKGVQNIIPAFQKVLETHPDALLVLANAIGPYKEKIKAMLGNLSTEHYRLIEFETEIAALYRTFTCFVHTPLSEHAEAFGQTYIEAMASEVPCIITLSGVAREFAKNRESCVVVPYGSIEEIASAVNAVLTDPGSFVQMTQNAKTEVRLLFDVREKYRKLDELYLKLLSLN